MDNAIFNQVDVATNASTVLNIDDVRTRGIELAFNQRGFITSKLDMRFPKASRGSVYFVTARLNQAHRRQSPDSRDGSLAYVRAF